MLTLRCKVILLMRGEARIQTGPTQKGIISIVVFKIKDVMWEINVMEVSR